MSDIAIKVKTISKRYRIGVQDEVYDTFLGTLAYQLKYAFNNFRKVQKLSKFTNDENDSDVIWALKNISFEVKHGDVLGIIGRNGAGKSTLLKILSRITEPTSGWVKVNGRIASLLEVGTGFHPELTGRENVFLNGAILGMTKIEIEKKFDEIIDFSGVEKYIDTPVKRYSSGMRVRLAFAVAAHLEPEILLIDEVLAVGDIEFQRKCLGKMKDISGEGRTILFVSHNMGAINNLCKKGIVLSDGKIIYSGDTQNAINEYLSRANIYKKHNGRVNFQPIPEKLIQIMQVSMTDIRANVKSQFEYSENVVVNIGFDIRESNFDYYCVLFVLDMQGNWIYFTSDDDLSRSAIAGIKAGQYKYQIELPSKLLKPGKYYITVSLTQNRRGAPHDRRDFVLDFEIIDNKTRRGMRDGYRKPAMVAPEINWKLIQ